MYNALSCEDKHWKKKITTWLEFVQSLREPRIAKETAAEYAAMSNKDRHKAKDLGCYIPAELIGGSRKAENVKYRTFLTYDIDESLPIEHLKAAHLEYGCEMVIHSTRSHTPAKPKHRFIIPVSRPMLPDEYEPVARAVAADMHPIEFYDNSTFALSRLMHYPSVHADALHEYEFYHHQGWVVDVDGVLARYKDYRDMREWALPDGVKPSKVPALNSRQADPLAKQGIVGTFCRAYGLDSAITELIPDAYQPGDIAGRYTYAGGSGNNGAVVYEDKYLYSHHATDPTFGTLCNAFDLIRVHKFGKFDKEVELNLEADESLKSYKKMVNFVEKLPKYQKQLASEKDEECKKMFNLLGMESPISDSAGDPLGTPSTTYIRPVEVADWEDLLTRNKQGQVKSNATNVMIILKNDPKLKGVFATNEFTGDACIIKSAPWRAVTRPERIKNLDDACLRNYLAVNYEITGVQMIKDCFDQVAAERKFHPIKEVIENQAWDGVARIETLLTRLFGVDQNLYHAQVMRKLMLGMIARVYDPGCKFDLAVILTGATGLGKSSFIQALACNKWYTNSFQFKEGKESMEQVQGYWLVEIAELANFRKKEASEYKAFLTKQVDAYRPAYGTRVEEYPRKCVFIGTTNEDVFLKDETGNRRFLPVNIGKGKGKPEGIKEIWDEFLDSIPQLYAEALVYYKAGESLDISSEVFELAEKVREEHFDVDAREGLLTEFLDAPVAPNWATMAIEERSLWMSTRSDKAEEAFSRDTVTAAEIFVECFGRAKADISRYNLKDINTMMRRMRGWELAPDAKRFKDYGKQRYYRRV